MQMVSGVRALKFIGLDANVIELKRRIPCLGTFPIGKRLTYLDGFVP
jgi:hypothetical protein